MLAATPEGLIGLGPSAAIEVAFDAQLADKQRLLDAMAGGTDADSVAEIVAAEPAEADRLLGQLEQVDAVSPEPFEQPSAPGAPLIAAILRLLQGGGLPDLVWTADEALVVPQGLDESQQRRLLRAFIAGIEPRERRVGYGYAAHWGAGTVTGDVPDARRLEAALSEGGLPSNAIGVVNLNGAGSVALDPDELARLGVDKTHRLGPITSLSRLELGPDLGGLHLVSARMATPNLAHPEPPAVGLSGKGTGFSPEAAETIARGEAAERFAMGDLSGREIVRAREGELPGAVPGDRLMRHNARQYAESALVRPYDPQHSYLWTPASARDGGRRWVLADAVFNPFRDFERPNRAVLASSSGAAAHRTLAEATRRAFCELIERDAFMWTWIQRISRERIATASLPPRLRERVDALGRSGFAIDFVNLTLETEPVLLCVIHDRELLVVGACCDPDPTRTAEKSFDEAALVLALARNAEPIPASDVRTPYDHVRLYRDAAFVPKAGFLHSSEVEIELGEVRGGDADVEDLLAQIGEPLTVDLSSPATRPLRVVRTLVPGLVPISFGWDQEPLGMPLLAQPRITADGRRLGSHLDLAATGPLTPHPFA